jgi:hypothetical protein
MAVGRVRPWSDKVLAGCWQGPGSNQWLDNGDGGRPAQSKNELGERMMICQGSRLMSREERQDPYIDGNRIIEEGGIDDEVIDGTMKVGLVQLIGLIVIQRQVGIRVMGYQGVDYDLRRNTQREEGQHYTG